MNKRTSLVDITETERVENTLNDDKLDKLFKTDKYLKRQTTKTYSKSNTNLNTSMTSKKIKLVIKKLPTRKY